MRKLLLVLLSVCIPLVLACHSSQGQVIPQQAKVEDEVRNTEIQRRVAILRGDSIAWDRILSDRFMEVMPQGNLRTKQLNISERASGDMQWESVNLDSIYAHVHNNVAIVIAPNTGTGRYKGTLVGGRYVGRQVRFYAMIDGRWQSIFAINYDMLFNDLIQHERIR